MAVELLHHDLCAICAAFKEDLYLVLVALVGLEFYCLFEHPLLFGHEFDGEGGLCVFLEVDDCWRNREKPTFEHFFTCNAA